MSADLRARIEAIGDRFPGGRRHGWKARVAAELGISAGHLSRILSGERRPSAKVMALVGGQDHDVAAAVAALLALDAATRRKVIAFVEGLDDGAATTGPGCGS